MENNKIEQREDINKLVEKLEKFDIISFDIFDTLILRPFKKPTDLFRILGIKHNMVNFSDIRRKAEKSAREKAKKIYGHTEVTIYDIYQEINLITDLDVEDGVRVEFEAEKDFCYANPYMKKVFDELVSRGKNVIIVSDMYIPHDMMKELLENCGYFGEKALFVSCDYGMTKRNGYLYKYLQDNYIKGQSIIHIGDNEVSDIASAKENNITTYYYKKNDDIGSEIADVDMSPTIGSLYKGIINNYINNGTNIEKISNTYYRYGFLYSGILIYGYVNWLHKFAIENKLDKLLFLARDGYILKKVYDMLYNDIPSEYCLWSRHATLKTVPERDLSRYIWQFIDRIAKNNKYITIKEILDDLELNFLENEFHLRNISLETKVDDKIVKLLRNFIIDNKNKIKENSKMYSEAAKFYYKQKVGNSKRIGIVDLGWRGSGAISLKDLFENYWNFDCEVKSLIAFGISRKPGFDDGFVLTKETNTYAFSEYVNYDYSKKFQESLLINMSLIEILISSAPKPSFLNFEFDDKENLVEKFDREEKENYEIINYIHEGIIDFIIEYRKRTKCYNFLQEIPSRDASSPIMSLLDEEKYEKFAKDFKDFYYTYLVGGTNQVNLVSFYDVYKDELRKLEEKNAKKTELKKVKKKKKETVITKIFKRTKRVLKNKETRVRYYYAKCYDKNKVIDNIILIQSYAGDNFSGNPYYMLKELCNEKKYGTYTLYVAVKKQYINKTKKLIKTKNLSKVKLVVLNSRKYARLLSQAKYLINNVAFPMYFIKKKEQIYINTWHGTPLKGLGKSIKDAPHEIGNHQRDFFMTDYLIMPNEYTYNIMRKDYMLEGVYRGKYIVSGYPRNSIFYNEVEKEKIRKDLNLQNKKVIVYMPTWRRSGKVQSDKTQNMIHINKILSLLDSLEERLLDNNVVYVKLHYVVKDSIDLSKYKKIKAFPSNYETYEFLSIADCLITDYSSVMFDYANVEKKIILYAYDEEDYMNGRSVYTSIHNTPFSIAKTEEGVIDEIERIDEFNSYKDFKNKFCSGDSLDLCTKICEYIFLKKQNNLNIKQEKVINKNNILVYVGNLSETYKREWIFKALNYVDLSDKNIFLNFYKLRVEKNKFYINSFSDKYNYISFRGEKVITTSEGIAYVLYYKLKLNSKWIEKKINNIYKREVKRLFPNIKFAKVIDMIGNSVEILNLYSNIDSDSKEVYIINNNIYKLNKYNKYKKETARLFDKYNNIYVETGIVENKVNNSCKLKLVKQEKDNLFTNGIVIQKEVNDIFNNGYRRSYDEKNLENFQ